MILKLRSVSAYEAAQAVKDILIRNNAAGVESIKVIDDGSRRGRFHVYYEGQTDAAIMGTRRPDLWTDA